MANDSDDQGEKTEDPSQHRIDEFRKRGEVASSKELTSVLVLSASFLTLTLSVLFIYETLTEFMEWIYALDAAHAFSPKAFKTIVYKIATTSLKAVGPIFIVVFIIGILANIMQIGFLFSPEVLQWKPERLNPISGIKKLFSMRSLVEAIKGFLKFVFICAIVYFFLKDDMTSFNGYYHLDFFSSFMHGKEAITKLLFAIILGLIIIALGDFTYQKMAYKKKLMMTKDQQKREGKEQDGSPEVKQRIRAIQREIATKRMLSDVKSADVIVTNPTHISIALGYDKEGMVSPQVVAKGADHLAMRIREIAKEYNIPIVENVPLARAMYKTVKVGAPVPRSLYKVVAEVLAFVYKLKRKQKALG